MPIGSNSSRSAQPRGPGVEWDGVTVVRGIRTVWASIGVAAMVALGAAAPVHAAAPAQEGTFPLSLKGCSVSEEIELQGSPAHDYMRWETTGASSGCYVEIDRNGTTIESQHISDTAYHHSDWYYDGPGDTDEVCASTVTAGTCGPAT
jgi:hypothetical protein